MRTIILVIFAICMAGTVKGQDYSCEEVMEYVQDNGYEDWSRNFYGSSWVKSVTVYELDGTYYAVIDIKKSKGSYSSKEYIYCGIPESAIRKMRYQFGSAGESMWENVIRQVRTPCNCY